MPSNLLQGFFLGPWNVEPLRGAVSGPEDDTCHLEPKVMDVLVILAEHADQLVTRDELFDAVWQGKVVSDERLTHAIAELRRALQDDRDTPKYIETVPKRGYRLIGHIRLPEGSKDAGNATPSEPVTHLNGRKLGIMAIALLLLVPVYITFDTLVGVTDAREKSIAVLAFVNMSDDPGSEYFSDGVSEEIRNVLAGIPGLRVIGRASSFAFKGKNEDLRVIGRTLGVSAVLEGSVRRFGDRVRISVQLIDVRDGSTIWSEPYDRTLADIFAIQEDIANRVALEMKVILTSHTDSDIGSIEVVGTDNLAAYEKYLKGLQQKSVGSNKYRLQAEISFKEALALDPDYYDAMLQLAYTYHLLWSGGAISHAEATEYSRPFLDRLLEERPDNGRALALVTMLHYFDPVDIEKSQAELTAAIERTPNEPLLYSTLGVQLSLAGRSEEALHWVEQGIAVEPLSSRLHSFRAVAKMRLGELDEAEASYARAIELNPGDIGLITWGAEIRMLRKQYAEWFAMYRKSMELDPLDHELPSEIALRFYLVNLEDEADKYLQRVITIAPDRAYVRRAELYRQVMLGNHLGAREMSEAMLRDDIDDRWGTYWSAVMVFMSTMSELGRTDEALAVLEELKPGVSSPDFQPGDWKEMALQYFAVLTLAQSLPKEDTLRLLDSVVPRWDKSFPVWRDVDGRAAPIASAHGQMDIAVELALSDLETGMAMLWGNWGFFLYQYIYDNKALALQPAVAERLNELEAEAREAGKDIWAYIIENNLQL
jgi:TolB-like protein/DNA-binding winged helix-turn-helix (wHTH) protein/Tfp pilus assembly protein PilF